MTTEFRAKPRIGHRVSHDVREGNSAGGKLQSRVIAGCLIFQTEPHEDVAEFILADIIYRDRGADFDRNARIVKAFDIGRD